MIPPRLHHTERYDFRPNFLARGSRVDFYRRNRARDEAEVQALLDGLAATPGRAEDTAVVILADHGEAFDEHDWYFHGYSPDEAKLRTPLLMSWPGVEPGPIEADTSNLDVVPTVLDLLGLPPDASNRGQSWLRTREARPTISEVLQPRLTSRAVVDPTGRWKLWLSFRPGFTALFDLEADPGETRNVLGDHSDVAEALMQAADTAYVPAPPVAPQAAARAPD